MNWTGKIVGFIIGWIIGGPFVAVLGLIIGHFFDKGLSIENVIFSSEKQKNAQAVFFKATFCLMGYVAKCDGRVSEEEIRKARTIMEGMGLNETQKKLAIQYFTKGKQENFNIESILHELREACHSHSMLRLFMEIQFQAATINGQISLEKRKVLEQISQYFQFTAFDHSAFSRFFHYEQHHYQRQSEQGRAHSHQTNRPSSSDSYQILGINKDVSDDEVKKAYRRLMSQHHPDKLIAKGLPESMIKIATEKTQEIKLAYEQICKARGIK